MILDFANTFEPWPAFSTVNTCLVDLIDSIIAIKYTARTGEPSPIGMLSNCAYASEWYGVGKGMLRAN